MDGAYAQDNTPVGSLQPSLSKQLIGLALVAVPDMVVCWLAARLTDSGWSGFWITFACLQAIYFVFWFKNASWNWLLFWLFAKRQTAAELEDFFVQNGFPPPSPYVLDVEDYPSVEDTRSNGDACEDNLANDV